jgi:cyclopropane-fatty-acyl-phospholipid synthase
MQGTVKELLKQADVTINGNRPWDIKVHNDKFYSKLLSGGSLALGEMYMDAWWDCEKIDELIYKLIKARLGSRINLKIILHVIRAVLFNQQTISRSKIVGKKHYDIGNELYSLMLDKRMIYSCAYWKNAKTLDAAQEAKLDLICKKLKLKPGMKVLDIGCGWGGLSKYMAEKYKVKVTGITISQEQAKLAKETCKGLGVEIRLQDYRHVTETFDRIVSVGMFEHVGYKNYSTYMHVASRCLKNDGLFLLHTIGSNKTVKATDPWITKYIFPNGMLPSVKQIATAAEDYFMLEDWHSFGPYYDKTLMAWHKNFNTHWKKISQNPKYDARFKRMWDYYLLSCAGSFRARNIQLWQIVFSKKGNVNAYERIS